MHIMRTLAAVAVTGGTAVSLFGGAAVHTALTSDSPLTFTAGGATVAATSTTGASTEVGNLQPGETRGVNIGFDNDKSTVPVDAYITYTGLQATAGSPNAGDLVFKDEVNGVPTYVNIPLDGTPVKVASIPAGQSLTQTLVIGLAQNTGNSWNGASGIVHYTVHFQDSNGSDANGFQSTSNN